MSNEGTTITEDELARALKSEYSWVDNPGIMATHIFGWVATHREPTYFAGHMYLDAEEDYWYRSAQDDWILATSGRRYAHEIPPRPLVRLVPQKLERMYI